MFHKRGVNYTSERDRCHQWAINMTASACITTNSNNNFKKDVNIVIGDVDTVQQCN